MPDMRPKVLAIIEQALRDEFGSSAKYFRTFESILQRGGEDNIPTTHGAYVLICGDASHDEGVSFVNFEIAVSHVILSQYFEGIAEERMIKGGAILDFLTSLVRPGQWVTVTGTYAGKWHTTDYLLEVLSWRIPPPFEAAADQVIPGMSSDDGTYIRTASAGIRYQLPPSY